MPAYVNPHTSFFDKSFNETHFQSYILSLQISLYGLVFTIYDAEKNKFIVLESFRFVGVKNENQLVEEIDSIIDQRKWLNQTYKQVNIIYTGQICTLVPSPLFIEKEMESFLNFNQIKREHSLIQSNILKKAGIVNVFTIPKTLLHKVKTIWSEAVILHFSSVLIESLLINFKNKTEDNSLFVQLHKDYFELVFLKKGKLFFHNLFKFKTKEDFIYFLLAAIDQLQLNPETVKIILLGDFNKSSIYYEMVHQYIRHSAFLQKNETFNYSYIMDKISHHQFYSLFNVLQCE